jgi:hypothetical protein
MNYTTLIMCTNYGSVGGIWGAAPNTPPKIPPNRTRGQGGIAGLLPAIPPRVI